MPENDGRKSNLHTRRKVQARTKIKMCGLTRPEDIRAANMIMPEYIGFVFAPKSSRYVSPEKARSLKRLLSPDILAVGVFVRERPEVIAGLLNAGVIEMAQLHGGEPELEIRMLRELTGKPVIKAFRIESVRDTILAETSSADYVLLDSGSGGTGTAFDWSLIQHVERPYFLAGGLSPENAAQAVDLLHPYGVDVSSGIETNGTKDRKKMAAFAAAVRKEEQL